MLIDMGEVGYGHPLLDLGHAYSAMVNFVGDYEKVIGMPREMGQRLWDKAMEYAEKVINNGYYHLNTKGATNPSTGEVYSPYQMLFLADNDTNGAQYEAIFPVMFDGINTQSHGGMNFLILSCYSSTMSEAVPSGTDNSWGKCTRVRGKLIDTFFGEGNAVPETDQVKTMTDAAGDDRALFYSSGYTRYITDESESTQGFSCVKFRNVRSDGRGTAALVKVATSRVSEASFQPTPSVRVPRVAVVPLTVVVVSVMVKGSA